MANQGNPQRSDREKQQGTLRCIGPIGCSGFFTCPSKHRNKRQLLCSSEIPKQAVSDECSTRSGFAAVHYPVIVDSKAAHVSIGPRRQRLALLSLMPILYSCATSIHEYKCIRVLLCIICMCTYAPYVFHMRGKNMDQTHLFGFWIFMQLI